MQNFYIIFKLTNFREYKYKSKTYIEKSIKYCVPFELYDYSDYYRKAYCNDSDHSYTTNYYGIDTLQI